MKTFGEHLKELKTRFMLCLALLATGSMVGFLIHKPVEILLQKPLNQTLYYSNPAGGLSFVMQIAFGVGIVVALPMICFQLIQFARPAIKPIKTKSIALVILCSTFLSLLAILYAYFVSLPAALNFMTTFNSDGVKALIDISAYMKFLFAYLAGTIIAFQIPLVLFFTNKIRRFPPGGLLKLQRPAVIGSIVFAGIITPTVDPINQMLVALPIILLFELGAAAVVISNKMSLPISTFEIKIPVQPSPYKATSASVLTAKRELVSEITNWSSAPSTMNVDFDQSHQPPRKYNRRPRTLIMDIVTPSMG